MENNVKYSLIIAAGGAAALYINKSNKQESSSTINLSSSIAFAGGLLSAAFLSLHKNHPIYAYGVLVIAALPALLVGQSKGL